MNTDFTAGELENVLEYWKDISQDPEYISKETGLEINKILSILDILKKEGKIENYEPVIEKILLFREMIEPSIFNKLNLRQFNDTSKYLFNKKKINKVYDAKIFDIVVKSMEMNNNYVEFDCVIDYKGIDYPFLLDYDSEDQVYYGSREGKKIITELRNKLGDNIEILHQTTLKIIEENLPKDFWEVISKHN